jgi:transketolase
MPSYSGTREAFAAALMELAEKDPRVVLVSSDSVKAMRATAFVERYPERYFEAGIAEQNAVGMAAGLATCGLIPFVATYAGFITMRACEQMRTFVAYPGLNVKFVGANGGIFGGEREGVTHQFFEDLGIVRSIPGITVTVPADAAQTYHATHAIAGIDGPAFLRIGSGREHDVYDESAPYALGRVHVMESRGDDVALLSTGLILNRVLEAARALEDDGIGATVVDVHTLKPLDRGGLRDVLVRCGCAVTIEDHNIIGGLGSAVAECIAEEGYGPLVRVGLQDVFPESGEAEALLDYFEMSVGNIVSAARRAVSKKEALA